MLRPRDLVESELGVGLVYPHEEGWQRLDLWRAEQAGPVPLETALAIVRQVGEALVVQRSSMNPAAAKPPSKASASVRPR